MHYRRSGTGHPLLLIHGLVGSSRNWSRNVEALSSSSDVIAVDLFGGDHHGGDQDSTVQPSDASLKATADRLAAFLDGLGVGTVDLAGHSHGGAIALMFAARHSARVRRIVLFAPANPFCGLARPLVAFYNTAPGTLLARLIPGMPRGVKALALSRMYGDPARIREGVLEGYTDVLRLPGAIDRILAIIRGWTSDMVMLQSVLRNLVSKPVLLIWGDRDRAVGLDSAARLQQALPQSQLLVLPGVGHIPFEELPDACNQAMRDWLTSPVPAPVRTPPAGKKSSMSHPAGLQPASRHLA